MCMYLFLLCIVFACEVCTVMVNNNNNNNSIHEKLTHISENYFSVKEDISRTVEQTQKFFHENALQIIQNFIPTKQKSTTNHLPWIICKLK